MKSITSHICVYFTTTNNGYTIYVYCAYKAQHNIILANVKYCENPKIKYFFVSNSNKKIQLTRYILYILCVL